jgi:hypothetical protein
MIQSLVLLISDSKNSWINGISSRNRETNFPYSSNGLQCVVLNCRSPIRPPSSRALTSPRFKFTGKLEYFILVIAITTHSKLATSYTELLDESYSGMRIAMGFIRLPRPDLQTHFRFSRSYWYKFLKHNFFLWRHNKYLHLSFCLSRKYCKNFFLRTIFTEDHPITAVSPTRLVRLQWIEVTCLRSFINWFVTLCETGSVLPIVVLEDSWTYLIIYMVPALFPKLSQLRLLD